MKKRIIAMILAVLSLVGVFINAPTASAATSNALVTKVRSLFPIITYAMPSSGASRVYAYTDASLTTKQSSYYVDSFSEQIVVTAISDNGQAVKVRYLSGKGAARDKWFRVDDIFGLAGVNIVDFQANASMTVYRMSAAASVTKYGSVSKGSDVCYKLGNHNVGGTAYNTVIYKLSSASTVNGITARHKMGLVTQSAYASSAKVVTSSNSSNSSNYSTKVSEFLSKSQYKNGATWGSTKTPLLSSYSCKGCCAYAADFVKYVFNKNTPRGGTYFTNMNDIKAGDVIVLNNPHWFVVLERYSDGRLKVAEGNVNNGKVRISDNVYKIQNGQLYSWGSKVTTFNCGYHFK